MAMLMTMMMMVAPQAQAALNLEGLGRIAPPGVFDEIPAQAEVRRIGTGEEMCEGFGYNEQECEDVGCCHYYEHLEECKAIYIDLQCGADPWDGTIFDPDSSAAKGFGATIIIICVLITICFFGGLAAVLVFCCGVTCLCCKKATEKSGQEGQVNVVNPQV